MHIFLTGGTGYVGGAVATRLAESGHDVTGLARSDKAADWLTEHGVKPQRGSLEDTEVLHNSAQQADVVVHAAIDYDDPGYSSIDEAAVEALLSGAGGKPVIYASSTLVLSDTGPGSIPERESAAAVNVIPFKAHAEQRVLSAGGTVIRLGLVYGRNGSNLVKTLLSVARSYEVSAYIGTGEARWSQVHVDDAADLFTRVVDARGGKAGTLVHGVEREAATFRQIAEAIGRNVGVPVAALTEQQAAEALTPIFGPAAGAMSAQFTHNLWVTPSKAAEIFGWQPTSSGIVADLESGSYAAG